MTITVDGTLTDWSPSDRLERPETLVDGYALFGRYEDGAFLIALESAVPIGPNTTFWLNTDANGETGHLVFDWAVGAEFNINFGDDGIARPAFHRDGFAGHRGLVHRGSAVDDRAVDRDPVTGPDLDQVTRTDRG